jgi:DNA-binding transcriptional LysR family regulator
MNEIDLQATDLNLLHVFDCIYREGNLTRVGERLGRTQSAVSHALERLREQFSDPLFVRTSDGMRPTPRASELAPRISEALRAVRAVLQDPEFFVPDSLERVFRLSMSDYSETIVLPPLIEALREQAPGVQIEVLSTAAFQPRYALESGHIDLLIGNQDVGAGAFQQELFVDAFVCVVSASHPVIKRRITLKQYLEHAHVLFAPQGRGDRLLDEALRKQRIERRVAVRVPHIQSIPAILSDSPYVVTVPAKFAAALNRPDLRLLNPPTDLPALQVMQYWHQAVHQDPAHKWLRHLVHEVAEEL